MKYTSLGQSNLKISKLGFGCMGLSAFYGKPAERSHALALLKSAFYEHGINFFDTADMYSLEGYGHNEQLLGEAVREFRKEVIIATKCGIVKEENGMSISSEPAYIKNACDRSLKALNTDVIDLYYLHRYNPATPIEESAGALLELIQAGKIRYAGLSEANSETIRRAHAVLGNRLVALQTEYSVRNRVQAEAVLPMCRELGISFVPYSPLVRGMLGGQHRDATFFANSEYYDFRSELAQFQLGNFEKSLRFVDALDSIAKKNNCTVAQLSLAWLWAQGDDIIPIPGTSNSKHLAENAQAASLHLSPETLRAIDEACKTYPASGPRYPKEICEASFVEFYE